jgi:hypothetical protein
MRRRVSPRRSRTTGKCPVQTVTHVSGRSLRTNVAVAFEHLAAELPCGRLDGLLDSGEH